MPGKKEPIPELGYELQKESGEIIGEGELAWPDKHLVVLVSHQETYGEAFESAGWQVFIGKDILKDIGSLIQILTPGKK